MDFWEQIEKLQKKPAKVKEKILAVSVFIIMAAIVAIWIQSVKNSFAETANSAADPLKTMWSAAKDGFANTYEQIQKIDL